MIRGLRLGLLLLPAVLPAAAAPQSAPTGNSARYRCEAVYLPARSSWVRSVEIMYDRHQVHAVRIDGAPVYRYHVSGTTLRTALDNERITFDTARLSWQSDLRGLLRSEGRCDRED